MKIAACLLLAAASFTNAAIAAVSWTELGPFNGRGRVSSFSVNPANTQDILLGAATGGLWRSLDGGANWTVVDNFLPSMATATIARAPSNPAVIYAGTGEEFFHESPYIPGAGILKSTDGGNTWSLLPATIPGPDLTQPSGGFLRITRIAVHPTNSNLVVASTVGHLCNQGGVYRSTDGGASWTRVHARASHDVAFVPGAGNHVVASESLHCSGFSFEGGLIAAIADVTTAVPATNNSPSATPTGDFTRAFNTSGGRLATASGVPGLVVAFVDQPCTSSGFGQLLLSTDYGATWVLNSQACLLQPTTGYEHRSLWLSPDGRRVIAGGMTALTRSTHATDWWLTNAPAHTSSTSITASLTDTAPGFIIKAIAADPAWDSATNRRVFVAGNRGFWRADDIAAVTSAASSNGWTSLNNGLSITNSRGGWGSTAGDRVLVATQSNSIRRTTASGGTWQIHNGSNFDWVNAFGDATDANFIVGVPSFGAVNRTITGSASLASACSGLLDAGSTCGGSSQSTGGVPPMAQDPNAPGTLLLGGRSVWRSTNMKTTSPTWSAIKGDNSHVHTAIAIAPSSSSVIWAGDVVGNLFCTINGTVASPTWISGAVSSGGITAILIDPANSSRVFVARMAGLVMSLAETTSGCVASPVWTNRKGTLPNAAIRSLARHPARANFLYAGTDAGFFSSIDGGATWSASNEGPANVAVTSLSWMDATTLLATTHGRGAFKATMHPTVLAKAGDLDGSGTADIAWHDGTGQAAIWLQSGATTTASVLLLGPSTGWSLKSAEGDFDGDGKADILWTNADGSVAVWLMDGVTPVGSAIIFGPGTGWEPTHLADLDGDNRSDIVWKHTDGSVSVWLMNGTAVAANSVILGAGTGFAVVLTGDFNADGKADLVFRNAADSRVSIWLMNGVSTTSSAVIVGEGSAFVPTHVADLDGDGMRDLLFRHAVDGSISAFLMNGTSVASSGFILGPGSGWSISGTGRFDAGATDDIVWRNVDGSVALWLMNGMAPVNTALVFGGGTDWSVTHVRDYSGDARADMLWRNGGTNAVALWTFDGLAVTSSTLLYGGGGWVNAP